MMIDALMYGFIPNATTEKCERPPPENRSSRPASALPLTKLRELRLVHARDRDGRQQAEDDQQRQDVEDPAPDVRRAECVEERFEHGSGVVAGRRLGLVDRGSARRHRRSPRASWRPPRYLLQPVPRPLRRPGRRPWPSPWTPSGPWPACPRRPCRPSPARSRTWSEPSLASVSVVTPSAASGAFGTSRTLTEPPAASILARADAVKASATTNSRGRELAGAQDLERLVEGPNEPDRAQDVLVDGHRGRLAGLLGVALDARRRRPRRARRSPRC